MLRFLHEMAANLFFLKNYFLLFPQTFLSGILAEKSSGMTAGIFTAFSFWNGSFGYLSDLFRKSGKREGNLGIFLDRLESSEDPLLCGKRAYLLALRKKYADFVTANVPRLDRLAARREDPDCGGFRNVRRIRETEEILFDSLVFAHETYVGLCNLFSVRKGGQFFLPGISPGKEDNIPFA